MSMNQQELYELLNALNNGTISPADHARLDEALTNDSAARELYYDFTDVHLQLHRKFSTLDPQGSPASSSASVTPSSANSPFAKLTRGMASHLLAIAATLFGVLAFQQLGGDSGNRTASNTIAKPHHLDPAPSYIATLTKSANCVWDGDHRPKFDGQRLLTNELDLKEGIAEFQFDAGVRVVMEGPASLTIESATSALLAQGKVVLHGDEMGDPFSLHTPITTLLDIGTEYGAEVDTSGATEVHVFDGEVSVVPRQDASDAIQPHHLKIGQASRFAVTGTTEVDFAAAKFKRQVPESELPSIELKGTQLAYEGFDYQSLHLGMADGGKGWAAPWSGWYGKVEPSVAQLQAADSLGYGPCLKVFGKKNASWRTLQHPIRLDEDGVYYLTFLLRKTSAIARGKSQYGSVEFRSDQFPQDDSKLAFGMSSENHSHMSHNKQQLWSAPPIPLDQTVRFVAKIVAGKQDPDQVMLRWYGPDEVIGSTEPHIWNCVSQPDYGDTVFEKICVRVGGDVSFLVDELRIGTTWAAILEGASTGLPAEVTR